MIQSGELRLGNWYVFLHPKGSELTHMGEYIKLDQSHFATAQEEGYELKELLWPIQLSDQIIAESGFVNGEMGGLKIMRSGMDTPGYMLYADETWLAHIVDLHHLQNLVAGLNSRELAIQF